MDRVLACVSHTSYFAFCALLGIPLGCGIGNVLKATELPVQVQKLQVSTPIEFEKGSTDAVYICAFNISDCLRTTEVPTLKPISRDFQVRIPDQQTKIIKPEKKSRRGHRSY